ncbi:mucin-19-like isoform X1 [Gossypium australe]|uniref:Mucin-19-like isoform X1 n=1 Tax=Gossypium australe TaxID=47621 RepID=A0A5B6USC4_9ROSI|nr:mucin-19-like isoform X1 [Gossypium australe]
MYSFSVLQGWALANPQRSSDLCLLRGWVARSSSRKRHFCNLNEWKGDHVLDIVASGLNKYTVIAQFLHIHT